jgi:hypothetical protein
MLPKQCLPTDNYEQVSDNMDVIKTRFVNRQYEQVSDNIDVIKPALVNIQ